MITRRLSENIEKRLFKGKAILIYGPRQAGKTTLLNKLLDNRPEKVLRLNGDEHDTSELFQKPNASRLKSIIGAHEILFIDEAQRIPNIGLGIKIIIDQLEGIQIIATGSSSFELAHSVNEPLTGRKYEFNLYPLSFIELCDENGLLEELRQLENRLIYGHYPEIVTEPEQKAELLGLLTSSYLYKDILSLGLIKKPIVLQKLLKALALQIGSEVSYNELGQTIGADKETVEKYIDLLEKAFVVFKLPAWNKNVRNEIKKGKKIYFYDVGIRNAIIGDYRPLSSRNDIGALWENFLITERKKMQNHAALQINTFFWRTTQQQEVDYIEETLGKLFVFEFKWNNNKRPSIPLTFKKAYPVEGFAVINQDNYESFISLPVK